MLVPRATLFGLIVAPLVWVLYFGISYLVAWLGCSLGLNDYSGFGIDAVRLALVLVALVAFVMVIIACREQYGHWKSASEPGYLDSPETAANHRFLALAGIFLCGISMLGIVWGLLPVFLVKPCA
jgi:hypothetical protein